MPRGKAPTLGRNLIHRIGHRGTCLLFFSLLDFVYAYSLFNPPREMTVALMFLRDIAPLRVWGGLWLVVAVICLVSAFRIDDRWGFTAAMLIKVLWGGLYVYGAFHGVERAYVSAAIWLCMAGWVFVISSWPAPTSAE